MHVFHVHCKMSQLTFEMYMYGGHSIPQRVRGITLLEAKYDNSNRDNQFTILVISNISTGSMIYFKALRRKTFP